jgi:hypothetical protein
VKAALGILALLLAGCAAGSVSGTARLSITDAPAPPVIVVEQPQVVPVPRTEIYVVQNAPEEVYFYGGAYWCLHSGYWYRASEVRGPFVVVSQPPPQVERGRGHWHGHGQR